MMHEVAGQRVITFFGRRLISARREGTPAAALGCKKVFFSSRRRHTRCLSDWSSDVCSSDLFSLLVIGFLSILAGLINLEWVISAMLTGRILIQFIAQIFALHYLRKFRTDVERPFKTDRKSVV